MRKVIIAAAAATLTLFATGCEDATPELVEQAQPAAVDEDTSGTDSADEADATDEPAEADAVGGTYRVGDTVAMGDLEHIVHGARWSTGDEWFGPDDGERWLVLDIEVTNSGSASESISSLIMWTLIDADNRSVDMTITGDERGSLDGELGAGRSMRGETAFSVPDNGSDTWELVFEPQLFGFGQAIYVITSDDVTDD